MAEQLTFKSWQRSKIFDLTLEEAPGGRLKGKMPITIKDINTGQESSDVIPFTLMAACDVSGLKNAIKHMAPAPFARDAETTKLVHIDLWESSLPWRYTPELNNHDIAMRQRPWMVLLVGTAKEIQVQGGIANVDKTVLQEHDLTKSHLWAHVQHDGFKEIGRILSPRGLSGKAGLLPQHQYVALLVPAFNEEGKDMWTVKGDGTVETSFGKKGVLPAFHSWSFMTAEAGDFETLAEALHPPSIPSDIGKAKLHYRRNIDADNLHINESLEIRGAITSLQQEPDQQVVIGTVRADLDILNDSVANAVGLPIYGRPWLADPDGIPTGWPADLNDDPRFRGIAGLGLWMGIEAQEALVDAAVKQAGALREAGQRIGNLALGLMAAGSLWSRRMPTDKNERLRMLGPMMGRMLATGGGLVLDKVTAGSPLAPGLFSSAAQRLLRDRSTQTRHLTGANGGINRTDALNEANQLEKLPERAPDGIPHIDAIAKQMGLPTPEDLFQIDYDILSKIWLELIAFTNSMAKDYRERRDELAAAGRREEIPALRGERTAALIDKLSQLLQSRLEENHLPCEGRAIVEMIGQSQPGGLIVFFAKVLENDLSKRLLYDSLWTALCKCVGIRPCREQTANAMVDHRETFCDDMIDDLSPPPFPDKRPVDLGQLSDLLFTMLDPRQPDAPAKLRLCARLKGIDCTRLVRPEFQPGLDFPTWELLKKYDKEWLLPGVNGLEKNTVLALQTNPVFIDAYMAGINAQFMSEMRWRDLPVDRNCTPLRMFWGQVNYTTGLRQTDIEPMAEWAKVPTDPIGALSHQTLQPDDPANTGGNRLVIVFRTDLFRRYPSTLVYLVKPAEGDNVDALLNQVPVLEHKEDERPDRKFFGPVFAGTITPEITFFSFDVTPGDLDKFWLVLDEPPAELRFRNDQPFNAAGHSAVFASDVLDKPTRVALRGSVLKQEGNQ